MLGTLAAQSLAWLAQAPTTDPLVAGGSITSVWDFVVKGGPTMLVIGACSLVALAVIAERLIVLRRRSVAPPDFVAGLKSVAADPARALEFCRANGSPLAEVLAAAIRRRGERIEAVEKAVEEAGRRITVGLRRRMRVLGVLPQVSTMLGLLGTIFGMIKTFQAVAASGQSLGKKELLAKGIFEAWTCTAAGLLVAIPVLVAYHALMGRIDALVVDVDRIVVDWVENERGGALAATTAPASASRVIESGSAPGLPVGVATAGGGT